MPRPKIMGCRNETKTIEKKDTASPEQSYCFPIPFQNLKPDSTF